MGSRKQENNEGISYDIAVVGLLLLLLLVTSVVSDSMQHHRWQPTRLHGPWDSPGQNTGVELPFPSPVHESEK